MVVTYLKLSELASGQEDVKNQEDVDSLDVVLVGVDSLGGTPVVCVTGTAGHFGSHCSTWRSGHKVSNKQVKSTQ